MNHNTVLISDNDIIHVELVDDQVATSVTALGEQLATLVKTCKAGDKPALVMTDVRSMGSVTPEARKLAVDLIRSVDYDKFAVIGGSGTITRFATNLILQSSAKGDRVKYFDDLPACIAWLLQP